MKRIGVLTSGGDAPGMNAAIRAVVRTALMNGMSVVGFKRGYNGMLMRSLSTADDYIEMNARSVSGIIHKGGTGLMTARCLDFLKPEIQKQAVRNARALDIEGMVCIGGNGTFKGAEALNAHGLPTIGVPATIDNDLAYTDFTIGFDTALNTAVEAVNRIRDTGDAHERASIVTVMGRDCGDLALYTALACGAEAAIVPEVKWSVEKLGDMVHRGVVSGKRSMILVFAEGASRSMVESLDELEAKYPKLHIFGDRILSDQLAEIVEEVSGHETRATVLGYTQRGGSPTANDRILATRTGAYAVKLLANDIGGRAVGVRGSDLIDVPLEDCMKGSTFDPELYELVGVTGYIKKN
ncbi:MAG: 6-phosphofructokinase [Clostridia bacterium]|nr:6-phosphofructokinase [Clostridia bacterium]